jgi:hypothetical protein
VAPQENWRPPDGLQSAPGSRECAAARPPCQFPDPANLPSPPTGERPAVAAPRPWTVTFSR